jgi:Uma2 family endonuclease
MTVSLPTRAAEGWDRRAFTVAEVLAMRDAGILHDEAGYELWEGELVPADAKHNRHELWRRRLDRVLQRGLPGTLDVAIEPSLYLSDVTFLEPDILIHSGAILPEDVRGPDALLVIEISDSTLAKDLGPKAGLYARHGVRHYWVLDADARRALVHTEPGPGGFARIEEIGSKGALVLPFEPALTPRLEDLG